MNRKNLVVSVFGGGYAQHEEPALYVQVHEEGRANTPLLMSGSYPPGPDLLKQIDRAEMFVRHVADGADWMTAYWTAYPD